MEVTIIDYKERENKEGEKFYLMIVEGDITMVQSKSTGNFYATSQKASVTTTFDEESIKRMIGRRMPGTVERVDCDAYEFTVEDTGEVVTLSHRYQYVPAPQKSEKSDVVNKEAVY